MSNSAHTSDEELVKRLQAGDAEALATLYQRRQGAIYRFAWQMCGVAEMAEDVTQETFMALINGAARFDSRKGTVANFLYGVARFQMLRRWEREGRFVALAADDDDGWAFDVPDPRADLFGQASRQEVVERVREAVLTLPPHYREVVILCDLHELDYAVAARVTGCAIGTVRSRLHRARALLAGKLRAYAPQQEEEVAAARVAFGV